MDNFNAIPNPGKTVISCALGDPSVFGHLQPPPGVVEHVRDMFKEKKNNGYAPSSGLHESRASLALRYGPRMARKSFDVTRRRSEAEEEKKFLENDDQKKKYLKERS